MDKYNEPRDVELSESSGGGIPVDYEPMPKKRVNLNPGMEFGKIPSQYWGGREGA